MENKETIEHEAIIKKINENDYEAEILQIAACASCHIKKMCSVSDVKNKIINVQKNNENDIKVGDNVTIYISQNKGLLAVFFGYVLPLIIVVITLIILVTVLKNEGLAGLLSLSALAPYYLVLYFFRDKINRKYKFYIKK